MMAALGSEKLRWLPQGHEATGPQIFVVLNPVGPPPLQDGRLGDGRIEAHSPPRLSFSLSVEGWDPLARPSPPSEHLLIPEKGQDSFFRKNRKILPPEDN